MDANHPAVLAAGANDLVDNSPCKGSSCDLTPDIGISGIYFSFDSGGTWTQPSYTGLTAQNGTTHVGPIHTLPNYYENGCRTATRRSRSARSPARRVLVANGSRLYYATLPSGQRQTSFTGSSAAVVSRTDNVQAAAARSSPGWTWSS
jgi:hypothetical protein